MLKEHIIIGIHVTNRVKEVPRVQATFTEFGCNIRSRIGLHQVADGYCSPGGMILIEWYGDLERSDAMMARLAAIEGIDVQRMVFEHVEPPEGEVAQRG